MKRTNGNGNGKQPEQPRKGFGVSRPAQAEQDVFSFMLNMPGPRVLAARQIQRARGAGPVAPPPVRYCELKTSLLIREAAMDLGCSTNTILEMLDDGRLRAFGIGASVVRVRKSGDRKPSARAKERARTRTHVRVDSASVAELIGGAWKTAVTQPPSVRA